ncbi:hypothetical protein ML401_17965 [Bradyrhizobium sp. 62B]|uniref:hypothetical protein n=1 Tax=Bradyrhizobium sp. 62B TaxID=2898442 RepID=UPI002557CD4F|nr:hypothetical protein ML401_17965 [Bradyrhizobium sp. 62B]
MNQTEPSAEEQIAEFVASAAKQPLLDAAFELWRWRYRLDSIEGRPTAEEVRIYRTLTPQQMAERYRYDRDHAHEGPMFGYVKRATRTPTTMRSGRRSSPPSNSRARRKRISNGTAISGLASSVPSRRPPPNIPASSITPIATPATISLIT